MFVFLKVIFEKLFSKLSCVCLPLEKLVNGKYFPVKEKFGLVFRKVFSFYFERKTFPEVVKNLEMSYYLLIISNLVLKLLITIYILFWIFFFQFHPLEFNFYINFGTHFLFAFPLSFFIYQIWSLFFWLLLILFEIIYEMLVIIILISSSFNFFIF